MLFASKVELFENVPLLKLRDSVKDQPDALPPDPLVYARFYRGMKNFYLVYANRIGLFYGYGVTADCYLKAVVNITDLKSMTWDKDFTPCPLSMVRAYFDH